MKEAEGYVKQIDICPPLWLVLDLIGNDKNTGLPARDLILHHLAGSSQRRHCPRKDNSTTIDANIEQVFRAIDLLVLKVLRADGFRRPHEAANHEDYPSTRHRAIKLRTSVPEAQSGTGIEELHPIDVDGETPAGTGFH